MFSSQQNQARETAVRQLAHIVKYIGHLRRVDRRGRLEKAAIEFKALLDTGKNLTPNQLSYIDTIYEKTMQGMGFDADGKRHVDEKRKGLRYG